MTAWIRCPYHQTLNNPDIGCAVCQQEAKLDPGRTKEPGFLGSLRGERYVSIENEAVDGGMGGMGKEKGKG